MLNQLRNDVYGENLVNARHPRFIKTETYNGNLDKIRDRVMREHPDWDIERVSKAEHKYRGFLAECKASPSTKHSPTKDADKFWHAHLLFSRSYAKDCQDYFGYFLHHEPNDTQEEGHCNPCGASDCWQSKIDATHQIVPLKG